VESGDSGSDSPPRDRSVPQAPSGRAGETATGG
jgi:hypothetical protein